MTAPAALSRLIALVRRGERPVCVMLPGAGGGLQSYLRLAGFLGGTHNVYGIRSAGTMPGEEPETTVPQMTESVLAMLDEADLSPALLFGWSMGGAIGWEVCLKLAERGRRPDLVMVDTNPLRREATPAADGFIEEQILAELGPRADGQTAERVLRTFRAQVRSLVDHETTVSYAGRVLLVLCSGDTYENLREPAVRRWRELAPDLRCERTAASHFGVFEPEHLPELTGWIGGFAGVRAP